VSFRTISNVISLSGILIPTVFLFWLKSFGILLLASRIKVYGPGSALFIALKMGRLTCLVYSDSELRSWQINEKLVLLDFTPFNLVRSRSPFDDSRLQPMA